MAAIYVWHSGSNTSPYDTKAKAATTMATAISHWNSNTSDFIAVHTGTTPHRESSGSNITWSASNSTPSLPIPIYAVDADSSDAYTPETTAANVDATGSFTDLNANLSASFFGLWLQAGRFLGSSGSGVHRLRYTDCTMKASDDGIFGDLQFSDNAKPTFINSTLTGGNASCQMRINGSPWQLNGCTIDGTWDSTAGLVIQSTESAIIEFNGCDLSALSSGHVLLTVAVTPTIVWFRQCKMPASFSVFSGTVNQESLVHIINSDSATAQGERLEVHDHVKGDVKIDTGVSHDVGWSDETVSDTGQALSWKMTTTTNVSEVNPLEGLMSTGRIPTTGSKTFTIECWDGFTTALQNDEAWMEVFYLGTSGEETLWTLGSTRVIYGDTPANLTAGTGAANWTGEPTGRSVKFSLTVTVNVIGYAGARIYLGKFESGKALYVDPLVTVT